MSWRDRLRPASFRGVAFFVREAQGSGGRNVHVHRFPLRAKPFVEDLGQKEHEFALRGYVLGGDYDFQRERLTSALETAGPGTLVHPYRGSLSVVVLEFTVQESTEAGRLAQFDMRFVESGDPVSPFVVTAPGAAVDSAAAVVDVAQASSFAGAVSVDNVPAFVPEAAKSAWDRIKAALDVVDLGGASDAVNDLRVRAEKLSVGFLEFLRHPLPAAEEIQALIASIESASASRLVAFRAYMRLDLVRAPILGGTSALQARAQTNADEVVELARAAALTGAARALSLDTFDTYEDAIALRAELLERLDALAGELGDDAFRSMSRLRAELLASVPGEGDDLPHLDLYTPPAVLPALVIAWKLYGDRARDAELVARNRVANPGFVPMEPLQVKSA